VRGGGKSGESVKRVEKKGKREGIESPGARATKRTNPTKKKRRGFAGRKKNKKKKRLEQLPTPYSICGGRLVAETPTTTSS